jgi:hypothetical protein
VAFVNQKDSPSGRAKQQKKERSEVSTLLMSLRGWITSLRVQNAFNKEL